jgi:hypothetical protein
MTTSMLTRTLVIILMLLSVPAAVGAAGASSSDDGRRHQIVAGQALDGACLRSPSVRSHYVKLGAVRLRHRPGCVTVSAAEQDLHPLKSGAAFSFATAPAKEAATNIPAARGPPVALSRARQEPGVTWRTGGPGWKLGCASKAGAVPCLIGYVHELEALRLEGSTDRPHCGPEFYRA